MLIRTLLVLSLLEIPLTGSGQNMKLVKHLASNGVEYKVGSPMYLGTGTNDDQSFNYVRRSSHKFYSGHNYPPSPIDVNTGLPASWGGPALPAEWRGQTLEVQRIRQVGTKKVGYRIYLICSRTGIRNYWIDIEAAIIVGEVVNSRPH